jgi:uncharacterized damage-inducible protein DinB
VHPKTQFLLEMLDDMWFTTNWIDPVWPLLQNWPTELTQAPYKAEMFSVQDIVNHTAFWEEFGRRNLVEESLDSLGDQGDAAWGEAPDWMPKWPDTIGNYQTLRNGLKQALSEVDVKRLAEKSPNDVLTHEARAYTRAIHAAYHAGQLSILRRLYKLSDFTVDTKNVSPSDPQPFEGAVNLLIGMMDSAWSSGISITPFEDFAPTLDQEKADWRPREDLLSSTEIVNHMAFWEKFACLMLQRKSNDEIKAMFDQPSESPGWPEAGQQLISQHRELRQILSGFSDEGLAEVFTSNSKSFVHGHTPQWLIQGVIVHHAYHMGQLILYRQLAGDPV